MEGYAVELAYEFHKRNPLPYPVELYNYHYLLGGPGPSCLETGPKDKELKSTRIVGGRVPDYPGIHVSHRDVRGGYRRERWVCDSS